MVSYRINHRFFNSNNSWCIFFKNVSLGRLWVRDILIAIACILTAINLAQMFWYMTRRKEYTKLVENFHNGEDLSWDNKRALRDALYDFKLKDIKQHEIEKALKSVDRINVRDDAINKIIFCLVDA